MRTIHSVLEYNFTEEQKEWLLASWIINWCGGNGGFNFDTFIQQNISHLKQFKADKSKKLLSDLKEICYEHDFDYYSKKGFIISNYKMAKKVFFLLHWLPMRIRILASTILFLWLCKLGKRYYEV